MNKIKEIKKKKQMKIDEIAKKKMKYDKSKTV